MEKFQIFRILLNAKNFNMTKEQALYVMLWHYEQSDDTKRGDLTSSITHDSEFEYAYRVFFKLFADNPELIKKLSTD